jgi:hypothetical protein
MDCIRFEPNPRSNRDIIGRVTKIFDLALFVYAMTNSRQLRSHVSTAGFDWDTHRSSLKVTDVLRGLVPLRYLHLPSLEVGPLFNWNLISVTSLELRYDGLEEIFSTAGMTITNLYDLFQIKSLRHLSIEGARLSSALEDAGGINRAQTSNITSLTFPSCASPGAGLAEVLSWPTALKSFHLEFAPIADDNRDLYTARRFRDALYSQRNSLEELFICNFVVDEEEDGVNVESPRFDMRDFVNLGCLGVPVDFLVEPSGLAFSGAPAGEEPEHVPTWQDIFPPAVEILLVEFPLLFDWGEEKIWYDLLRAIAEHKDNLYPSLATVIVWKAFADFGFESFDPTAPTQQPKGQRALSAFQAAEIRLSHSDFHFIEQHIHQWTRMIWRAT